MPSVFASATVAADRNILAISGMRVLTKISAESLWICWRRGRVDESRREIVRKGDWTDG